MSANTMIIFSNKATQWDSAGWSDVVFDLPVYAYIISGSIYGQNHFASIGLNTSQLPAKSIISSAKLVVRGETAPGASYSNGALNIATFNFSSMADGKINRNPEQSTSMSSDGTAYFDIDPLTISLYSPDFGVFIQYVPSAPVAISIAHFYVSLEITYTPYVPLPPDTLSPNGTSQNPKAPVVLSWFYRESGIPSDYQIESILQYSLFIGELEYITSEVTSFDTSNTLELNRDGLLGIDSVKWKVRTLSAITGYSDWSETAIFTLAPTPPLKSILVFPLNVPVMGANGVTLEWRYNSPYDTKPSRFDIRYRSEGDAWIEASNSGQQKFVTKPIHTQEKVTWQVRAYGEWGDQGEWSDAGTFWTIGAPDAPTIVNVTSSNRPTIYFSAENIMSWELQITNHEKILHETGSRPFANEFSYKVNDFLPNGNYIVRIRTTNEYGLTSEWGKLAFALNTITPEPLKLYVSSSLDFFIRLHFNNTDAKAVYIYRSEFQKNKYLRIGQTNDSTFDDFTARPSCPGYKDNSKYEYFVRVIDSNDSYADSNIEIGILRFLETTLAEHDYPQNMLMLKYSLGSKPTKDISFTYEKTLTQFIGREEPVLQIGEHSNKSISLSFFCSITDYERLEQIHKINNILILRDWRVGVVYGTINGAISAKGETDGFQVSFVFTQTNFDMEVELI